MTEAARSIVFPLHRSRVLVTCSDACPGAHDQLIPKLMILVVGLLPELNHFKRKKLDYLDCPSNQFGNFLGLVQHA